MVNRTAMERIAADLPTKSAKIRALAKAGYRRSDIAKFIDSRYQFVRNVLVEDERRKQKPAAQSASGGSAVSGAGLRTTRLRVDPEGRVALPEAMRDALGVRNGDTLIASIADGELHLLTIPAAVRRAQALVRQFVPEGASLVDELLDDRKREAEREAAE